MYTFDCNKDYCKLATAVVECSTLQHSTLCVC